MTPTTCAWFARCTNAATATVTHPVLGNVPTCQRCIDKLGLEATPTSTETNKHAAATITVGHR